MSGFDAVVIGGGIVGRAAAYELVKGGARVLVLEAGRAGRASDAGAGILAIADQVNHPDPVQRFVARAAQHYPELIRELEAADAGPTGYRVCGRLTVAIDPAEGQELERLRQHFGAATQAPTADPALLDAAQARGRFPPLREVRGAIYSRRGARVDGRLIAAALTTVAERRGALTRPVAADRLLAPEGRITGVVTRGETIRTDRVVLAAGAWSRALGATVGLDLPIAPQRGQIAHLDVDAETREWPIVTGFGEHYMVPWDDRRIAVGATRESGAGFEARTTVEGLMEVLGEALRLAPGLGTASLREVRVGLRPASADGLPIVGAAPHVDGLFIAAGHGALGLQLGPYSGKAIAGLILSGAAPSDLTPFAPSRFQAGEAVCRRGKRPDLQSRAESPDRSEPAWGPCDRDPLQPLFLRRERSHIPRHGSGPTILILMAAIATASLANWRERGPRAPGNPPLLPPTAVQMVALVVALLMAAHLVSLLSGQPLRSRFGI